MELYPRGSETYLDAFLRSTCLHSYFSFRDLIHLEIFLAEQNDKRLNSSTPGGVTQLVILIDTHAQV